jgi:uncharacterized protein with HEPN domain
VTDDRLFLLHVRDCISRVREYVREGRDAFLSSALVQDAVLRNLQILAESTQRLSEAAKAQHPSIDWRGIAAFRNVLVHKYLGVDLELVWQVIEQDLPELAEAVAALLAQEGADPR